MTADQIEDAAAFGGFLRPPEHDVHATSFLAKPPRQGDAGLHALHRNGASRCAPDLWIIACHAHEMMNERKACGIALELGPRGRQIAGQLRLFFCVLVVELNPPSSRFAR